MISCTEFIPSYSGLFTYLEDKLNSEAPETYNNLEVIYKGP